MDACGQQSAAVKPQMLHRSFIATIALWDENDHVLGQQVTARARQSVGQSRLLLQIQQTAHYAKKYGLTANNYAQNPALRVEWQHLQRPLQLIWENSFE